MLAILLVSALLSGTPQPAVLHAPDANLRLADAAVPATGLRKNLMDSLMDKFHTMNDARQGFFQDDISPIVAPYFPPGQPFAETQKVIQAQNLGHLEKFQGTADPSSGTMYVTKFDLMNGMFSQVYVVLNFDFEGTTDANMIVKKATAYIRGSNM